MKKLVLFLFLGISLVCYPAIKKSNVEARLLNIIARVKSGCTSTAISLGNAKSKAQAIIQTFSSSIDTEDKTKLQGLNSEITAAKDALDSVLFYIETNFDSIE